METVTIRCLFCGSSRELSGFTYCIRCGTLICDDCAAKAGNRCPDCEKKESPQDVQPVEVEVPFPPPETCGVCHSCGRSGTGHIEVGGKRWTLCEACAETVMRTKSIVAKSEEGSVRITITGAMQPFVSTPRAHRRALVRTLRRRRGG